MICYLELLRTYYKSGYIIGKLFVNGEYYCDTLEPSFKAVHGAIPEGCYQVDLNTFSPTLGRKFPYLKVCQGKVPRLLAVPNRSGILIHCLNTPDQTEGCIGVGFNKVKGQIIDSVPTFKKLYFHLIDPFYDSVQISIQNVFTSHSD